jgi:hypothetical protein
VLLLLLLLLLLRNLPGCGWCLLPAACG